MGNRLVVLFVLALVASLLLLSGCKGKDSGTEVDLTVPPPLPEETAAEEQPPAPPASDQQSGQEQLPELPLFS